MLAGERLVAALANARQANVHNGSTTWRTWLYRLRTARRQVEHAAEQYASALKTFREATEAEFAPQLGDSQRSSPMQGQHDCVHAAGPHKVLSRPVRAPRKEPGAETGALAARRSKSK